MTRILRYLLLFVLTVLSGSVIAQEIGGKILDDKKEPLPSAAVQVYQGGILKGGGITDIDGDYVVKPLDPGTYNVLVLYAGYDSILVTGVTVTPGGRTTQNFTMSKRTIELKSTVVVRAYRKPLINQDEPDKHVMTADEIKAVPTTQVTDLVSLAPGVYSAGAGRDVNIGGARNTGTLYIIDGVQVQGLVGVNLSQGSIDQLEVITSGIPANYGDVSGGVVNITSRGVAQKLTGDIRLQHSIDGYNNNLGSFSIAGPIYKKTVKNGEYSYKKPVLGFMLSGDIYDDHNRYPTFDKQYVAKGDVLQRLQQHPLTLSTDNSGNPLVNYSSLYITKDQLETVKQPPHNEIKEYRTSGKVDYQLTDNMSIAAGGTFDYVAQDAYSRARILFAPEATPLSHTVTGRGYLRFRQKFGKSNDTSARRSIISNAYYSVQADYQKLYQDQQDPKFKENIFDYSYIGKFTQQKRDIYIPGITDSAASALLGHDVRGTVLLGSSTTGINYERSEMNPILANYTTQLYNNLPKGFQPFTIGQIQALNGLANGDEPKFTYDLVFSPGATLTGYTKFISDQYALSVDASFDLLAGKTKHAIEFGLYYQQRIEKSYSAYSNLSSQGTSSLWQLMRGLVSNTTNGKLVLDKANPIFVVGGKQYTLSQVQQGAILPNGNDTIIYNYINPQSTAFDQNLRKKLGYNSTQDINIDELSPSTYSLNLFSADELLNSGNPFVNYYGYTYSGETQSANVNFNDFWTKKDANGNYTRPIGAFTPNYIAGYLLDKFTFRDVHFNVGVRVDRYSANTKVLKDPYSEYEEKVVSQVSGATNHFNGGAHPGNMAGNYVVYVDDNNSNNPSIIGYRNGNNWYDPTGKFIEDPSVLKQYSGGRDPQPYLVKDPSGHVAKITDTNYNPNSAFTDYVPQVTVMPRVSFNFPISTVADFYAHYDIYAQRPYPTAYGIATAYDYYYLSQNAQQTLPNANLRSQKTFDYEVGFQQKLSDHSALTITAFYKERKDLISVVPILYAWPITYYTYGNRDFSTTKGSTLLYDLRATNHLRLNLSYTLQFAEGSGSTPTGGKGFLGTIVEAGLPNLRYVTALDYDSRHIIVADIDYRFGEGEGPAIAGLQAFQNAGVHFVAKARSGEPYTRYTNALANTVIGGVNGSRLPWHFGVDMRLDKDFALNHNKKHSSAPEGIKPKRPLYLKGILQVNNLFNTREIMSVYGYTGRPDDNGYLASPYGHQAVPQQTNPQSYTDLYTLTYNNPYNLNWARTISLAVEFNF